MITDDMLHTVLRRRAGGEPVEDIRPDRYPDRQARRENPSLASIYRAPAEHEKRQAQAQAERAAARAELDNAPSPGAFTDADVYARLDSMTEDVAEVLTGKRPEKLIEFYDDLELNLLYDNKKRPSM